MAKKAANDLPKHTKPQEVKATVGADSFRLIRRGDVIYLRQEDVVDALRRKAIEIADDVTRQALAEFADRVDSIK